MVVASQALGGAKAEQGDGNVDRVAEVTAHRKRLGEAVNGLLVFTGLLVQYADGGERDGQAQVITEITVERQRIPHRRLSSLVVPDCPLCRGEREERVGFAEPVAALPGQNERGGR